MRRLGSGCKASDELITMAHKEACEGCNMHEIDGNGSSVGSIEYGINYFESCDDDISYSIL